MIESGLMLPEDVAAGEAGSGERKAESGKRKTGSGKREADDGEKAALSPRLL